jgi:hypothetical protein
VAQQPILTSVELKSRLHHTWSPFFARHGNFTTVQQRAIPPILTGQNTLIIAATASGKTEAAFVPLLERHLFPDKPAAKPQPALCILYICPTRALVRDLYERLRLPLETLEIPSRFNEGPARTTIPDVTTKFQTALQQILFLGPNPRQMSGYSFIVDRELRGDGANLSSVLYDLYKVKKQRDDVLLFIRALPEQDIVIDFKRLHYSIS